MLRQLPRRAMVDSRLPPKRPPANDAATSTIPVRSRQLQRMEFAAARAVGWLHLRGQTPEKIFPQGMTLMVTPEA